MYSFTNYTFETESGDAEFRKYVTEKLGIPDFHGKMPEFKGNRFENEEDNVRYSLDMLCEALSDIARKYPGEDFRVTGVWDTSSTAGELMDFIVEYKSGKFSAKTSEWYVEESRCLYDSYEEFCEGNERDDGVYPLTEEEFENWKEEDMMFSLDSGYGDFVREVPVIYDYDFDFTAENR